VTTEKRERFSVHAKQGKQDDFFKDPEWVHWHFWTRRCIPPKTASRGIEYIGYRLKTLTALAQYLDADAKINALGEALSEFNSEDREDWLRAMVALASQLSGEQLGEVLTLALPQVFDNESPLPPALAAFAALAEQLGHPVAVLRGLRRYAEEHLWASLQGATISDVHDFCSEKSVFREPVASAATLKLIADHIAELGIHWHSL
jgi:hypothetical protein